MAKRRQKRPRKSRAQRRTPTDPGAPNAATGNAAAAIDLSELRGPLDIIAKSFAIIALRLAPVRPKTIQERALFLDGLGLSGMEIAAVLKSTPRSIGELISRARRK